MHHDCPLANTSNSRCSTMFSKFNVKGELCPRTTLHCGLLKSLEVVDTDTQSINQRVCPRERLLALMYVEFFHMRWRAMNIQPSGQISTPPDTARHRQVSIPPVTARHRRLPPRAAAHLQYRPGAPIAGCAEQQKFPSEGSPGLQGLHFLP